MYSRSWFSVSFWYFGYWNIILCFTYFTFYYYYFEFDFVTEYYYVEWILGLYHIRKKKYSFCVFKQTSMGLIYLIWPQKLNSKTEKVILWNLSAPQQTKTLPFFNGQSCYIENTKNNKKSHGKNYMERKERFKENSSQWF